MLFMGLQNVAVILENVSVIPQNIKNRTTIYNVAFVFLDFMTKIIESKFSRRYLYMDVRISLIHNSQNMKTLAWGFRSCRRKTVPELDGGDDGTAP